MPLSTWFYTSTLWTCVLATSTNSRFLVGNRWASQYAPWLESKKVQIGTEAGSGKRRVLGGGMRVFSRSLAAKGKATRLRPVYSNTTEKNIPKCHSLNLPRSIYNTSVPSQKFNNNAKTCNNYFPRMPAVTALPIKKDTCHLTSGKVGFCYLN